LDGLNVLDQAFDDLGRIQGHWIGSELHRLKGKLLLQLPKPEHLEAEASFNKGLCIAREQGARLFELRTSTSLARLWRDHGRMDEARDLLAPVHAQFTAGFETTDIQEAKAFLAA
jgi:predicted ATPase